MSKATRRNFLKMLSAGTCSTIASGYLPSALSSVSHAAAGNGAKLLIVNMNGGWDGLSIFQPYSGTLYDSLSALRPTLAKAPETLLPGDNQYGYHPGLTTFKALFDEGKLLNILNVGYVNMSRSHSDAETAFARGVVNRLSTQASGFVNRLGAVNGWTSLQGMSVSGTDPTFKGGNYRGVQVSGISSFRFRGDSSQSSRENLHRNQLLQHVNQSFVAEPAKLKQAEAVSAVNVSMSYSDMLNAAKQNTPFTFAYPNSSIGRAFQDVDVLFSNPGIGTELAYVKRGGFDTHSGQSDTLDRVLSEFDAALTAFVGNMKAKLLWSNLMILVVSEFGRTNKENNSQGTDHGGALPFFLMGGPIKGGTIGEIADDDLNERSWLPMKINVVELYRQLVWRMGYNPDAVFEYQNSSVLSGIFS